MKKGFLILSMSFFCSIAFAQGTVPKEAEKQQPAVQQEHTAVVPPKSDVKAVPAAKDAPKPERIVATGKQRRPAVARPARNPRPAARPIRAGRGR